MQIDRIKINGISKPVGFVNRYLTVSWNEQLQSGERVEKTIVELSDQPDFSQILQRKEDPKESAAEFDVSLCNLPRTTYYVRIRVRTQLGEYQNTSPFTTGKNKEKWQASWIGMEKADTFHPVFCKKFKPKRAVKKAYLHICGLGLYEARINGKNVSDEVLAPFENDYEFAFQAQTYEITDFVESKNELTVLLGNGWYKGRFGQENRTFGDRFALIAEIHFTYRDGSSQVIVSDESWEYSRSTIESSGIYDGEIQNDLLEAENKIWKKAVSIALPTEKLTDRYSIPVKVMEKKKIQEVLQTPKGETVLDMGQNFSGWLVFFNRIPKGAVVHLEFGEVLQNGCFYNENYRTATGGFTYRSDGQEKWVRPHFTWFGFRYVKISGWKGNINPEDFEGWVIYSDWERTGWIETGHKKLNQLYANCLWGLKSNFIDMPTDCPQRDERLGWTADAQIFAPTASYYMDTRAFYRKYLWDMRNVQKSLNGAIPAYLPPSHTGKSPVCSIWGDSAVLIPYTLWQFYGNRAALEENYPLMKSWVDYVIGEMKAHHGSPVGLWDFSFHFGDWLALDGEEGDPKGATPDDYLAAMYYYQSVKLVSEVSGILGYEREEKEYGRLKNDLKELLLYEYFTPAGHLSIETQTAYITAMKMKVYRNRKVLTEDFVKLLKKDHDKLRCGFAGAPLLCQMLSEYGRTNLAWDFLLQEEYPSWLYAVNLGATTIWERWNSLLADGTISGTGMNSLNHYSYGSVMQFLYEWAAGLHSQKPGFKEVLIQPAPDYRLNHLKCVFLSASGRFVVNWKLEAGMCFLHIEIPAGVKAVLSFAFIQEMIPDQKLTAGTHDFKIPVTGKMRYFFDQNCTIEKIMENKAAKRILLRFVPAAEHMIGERDKGRTVADLYGLEFMGISKKNVDEAVRELSKIPAW